MSDRTGDVVDRLKVTSPRLEKDEFRLTPAGRREPMPDARRVDTITNSPATRARGEWASPSAAVETTAASLTDYTEGQR